MIQPKKIPKILQTDFSFSPREESQMIIEIDKTIGITMVI